MKGREHKSIPMLPLNNRLQPFKTQYFKLLEKVTKHNNVSPLPRSLLLFNERAFVARITVSAGGCRFAAAGLCNV